MEKINAKENLIRLIQKYQNLIFSICLKLTGDYFVAEDLTQETFMAAYKHWEQYSPEAEKAWLCRIASNKCIDYLRAADRRTIPAEEEEIHNQERTVEDEPLTQVLNSEVMDELKKCCDSLPSPYREVAAAHFVDGKTAKEIAQESDTGINTVKSHIYRARGMLKKSYRKELLQK